jgi:hypothetical protein
MAIRFRCDVLLPLGGVTQDDLYASSDEPLAYLSTASQPPSC